jgi:hypothetical protein
VSPPPKPSASSPRRDLFSKYLLSTKSEPAEAQAAAAEGSVFSAYLQQKVTMSKSASASTLYYSEDEKDIGACLLRGRQRKQLMKAKHVVTPKSKQAREPSRTPQKRAKTEPKAEHDVGGVLTRPVVSIASGGKYPRVEIVASVGSTKTHIKTIKLSPAAEKLGAEIKKYIEENTCTKSDVLGHFCWEMTALR